MDTQDDRDFADVVVAIAKVRKGSRLTAIDVTHLFKPLTDRLSLDELRDFVLSRYPSMSGEGIAMDYKPLKFDMVHIEEGELRAFDRAFLYKDRLDIVFGYSDDRKVVKSFKSVLLNGQL
jgi:hypothetical protein